MSRGLGHKQMAVLRALAELRTLDAAAGHVAGLFHPLPPILSRALLEVGRPPDTRLPTRRPTWKGRPLSETAADARIYRALYTLHARGFVEAMQSEHGRLRVFRISSAGIRALELTDAGMPIPLYG